MTLKSSLSKATENLVGEPRYGKDGITLVSLTLKVMKRHIWLLVLAAIGFLLNMPVAVALVWSNIPEYYYTKQRLDGFAEDMCMVFNMGSAMIISVGAVLAAFTLFRYLHNRRQVDFFHSLPIRREKMYAANMLAGLLIFLLPYLTAHLLALPLLAGSGMLTYIDMANYISAICMHIFAYMVMFALASMAMLLSGNMGGAMKILFSTYAICPIISAMLLLMGSMFLTGYADLGSCEMLFLKMSVIERYLVMMFNELPIVIYWQDLVFGGVILAGAVVAGLFLYKKRNSECAGDTLAFGWQKPIFKYPYVVLAGVLGAVTMYAAGDRSLIWLAFGLLFFTVFAAQAMEIAIVRDFRAIKRNLRGAVISLVLVGMIVGAYGLDIFGYEKWQPEADKVEAVIINSYNIDNMKVANYRFQDEYTDDYNWYYSINPMYYYWGGNALTVSDEDNVAALVEILTSEPTGYGEFHSNGDDVYDDYYGYYDFNDGQYDRICFKMKNGGYKMRYMQYGGITANSEAYKILYDSEEIRSIMSGSLDIPQDLTIKLGTLEDYTAIYGYDFGTIREQDESKVRELWDTYRSEFAKLSGEELIKTVPLGEVDFRIYENYVRTIDNYDEYFEEWTDSWYHSVWIYPQMTETIKMMRGFYGNEVLGNQNGKYEITEIIEYTPKNPELLINSDVKSNDDDILYEVNSSSLYDDTVTVEYSTNVVKPDFTVSVTQEAVKELDNYTARSVDLSRGAEIVAETVAAEQIGNAAYYNPWRRTNCLKYYDITYRVEGSGGTVVQTRYQLPDDRN